MSLVAKVRYAATRNLLRLAIIAAALQLAAPPLVGGKESRRAETAAQGFGGSSRGGAGQPIYRVRNLDDDGPWTLREAVSRGHRRIVFEVSGTIFLQDEISISVPFVTIDGTTAPAPGITLRGHGLRIHGARAHDVIVRGLRIRDVTGDALAIGAQGKDPPHRVLIDRISAARARDGVIDITHGAHDVTVQWSVLGQNENHNLLSLVDYRARRITFHHNLFANGESRMPHSGWDKNGTTAPEIVADVRNNLIWNFEAYGSTVKNHSKANIVNNYYYTANRMAAKGAIKVHRNKGARAYVSGNHSKNGVDFAKEGTEEVPFEAAPIKTTDACTAARDVVARAGARPLDRIDRGILAEIDITCVK